MNEKRCVGHIQFIVDVINVYGVVLGTGGRTVMTLV